MTKIRLFLIATFLLLNLKVFSQDSLQNKKTWNLEECINYAIKNSISVQRARLSTESYKAAYEQSIAGLLPSINASATHNYNVGKNIDPTTNNLVQATSQTNEFSIGANLNLFRGLQTQNNIRQNKAYYQATLADIEQAQNDISLNVTFAYLDIVFNKELLIVSELQLKSTDEQLLRTDKLVKAGSLPESNLLDVKSQKATDELNIVNAQNSLELSKLKLLQYLLIEGNTEFDVAIPSIPEIAQLPLGLNSSEIYKIALSSQPIIRSADLNIKASRYAEMASKGGRYPRLSFGGGLGTRYFRSLENSAFPAEKFSSQFKDNLGQYLGFSLNVPIFNNLSTRTQVQNSIISRRRIELNAIEIKNTLRQNVEQAYLNAKSAEKRFYSTKNQVEALKESFRVTEQRFNVGVLNSLDYTVAKNNLNKAESDFVRAKYDFIFRIKILDFYQNKPLTLSNN